MCPAPATGSLTHSSGSHSSSMCPCCWPAARPRAALRATRADAGRSCWLCCWSSPRAQQAGHFHVLPLDPQMVALSICVLLRPACLPARCSPGLPGEALALTCVNNPDTCCACAPVCQGHGSSCSSSDQGTCHVRLAVQPALRFIHSTATTSGICKHVSFHRTCMSSALRPPVSPLHAASPAEGRAAWRAAVVPPGGMRTG
jgi:hypothetical protein